jgi:hypothetical protein
MKRRRTLKIIPLSGAATIVPRKPRSRHSFDENLDEPGKLIEQEPADLQRETPDEGNAPVETIEEAGDETGPPAFEDDDAGE